MLRLKSLGSDGGGEGAREEEGGGDRVGDEPGVRSDGGGDGGELTGAFRGDASGGLEMEGERDEGESAPVCGGGAGDSAIESEETVNCAKSRAERTAQQIDANLAILYRICHKTDQSKKKKKKRHWNPEEGG